MKSVVVTPRKSGMLYDDPHSQAMTMVRSSRWFIFGAIAMAVVFVLGPFLLMLAPWQQNIRGMGRVIAYAPLERQQQIEAPINGRIVQWWVQEGSVVNEGDPLLEISDIDPNLMTRMAQQKSALENKLAAYEQKATSYEAQIVSLEATRDLAVEAAKFRLETRKQKVLAIGESLTAAEAAREAAEAQFTRKQNLLAEGIVSQRQFEVAKRDVEQARTSVNRVKADLEGASSDVKASEQELAKVRTDQQAKIESVNASLSDAKGQAEDTRAGLAKIEVQLSRQQSQRVTAPRKGTVFRLVANQGGEIVKAGDPLLTLVPETLDRAVEIWVDGNDAPLIREGSLVRLQFEGWPAVQFVGWPSVAIGTFGGKVSLLDATDDGKGRFRLLVEPDESEQPWPDVQFLRQGVRAKGWVLLNRVALGYEIWRQLNGFPPVVSQYEPKSDVARKKIK